MVHLQEKDTKYKALRIQSTHKWYKKRRSHIIELYGGKCACCEEDRKEFLSIDHINGGGTKDRKQRSTSVIQTWLAKEKREGYRILCHNCNQALGYYGYCPHTKTP